MYFEPFDKSTFEDFLREANTKPDYTTNAGSYYKDLARKQELIKILAKRIWEYDTELAKRFEEWDKNLEDFPDDVKQLLRDWIDDGTFAEIINEEIFSWKADLRDLNERGINVKSLGVVGDGKTIVTEALNSILYDYRGHKIFIPDGVFIIDNSLMVYNDSVIELSKNAVIKFKEGALSERLNPNEHIGRHIFKNHLTEGNRNIEIFGGMIDGSAPTQAKDSHRGFFMEGVDGLKIHDIKVKEIAGWGLAHAKCNNFHFYNIEFDQAQESLTGYNGDGITGMSSNGLIENISGYVSDDLVSLQAGNNLFSPQLDVRNVTVRGIYPKAKNGEYPYRALGLYAYLGYELDHIMVDDVRGKTKHELLIASPYYDQSGIKGKMGNLTLSNIDLQFEGVEQMGVHILNADINTLIFDKLTLKNLNGSSQINAIRNVNSTINRLVIDKLYSNKIVGDQPFIDDRGDIRRLEILNSHVFNNALNSGYIYVKNTDHQNVTEIVATNLRGNVGSLAKGSKDTDKIRVKQSDFLTQETFITSPNLGDIILTNEGLKVYKNNRFNLMGDMYNIVSVANDAYTLTSLCSVILVSGSVTSTTITLHTNVEKINWDFKLSVPENCIVTINNGSGQRIFTSTIIDTGVYSIVRNGTSWLISKISNVRYVTG